MCLVRVLAIKMYYLLSCILILCMRTITPTGHPFCGVGFKFSLVQVCMSNLEHVDLISVEYLGLQLHRVVVNTLLGSWAFVVYLGL